MKTNIASFLLKLLCAASVILPLSAGVVSARTESCSRVLGVLQKYGGCEGVESINLGPFLMSIARIAASGEEEAEFLRYINRMAVFSAEEASGRLKKEISDDLERALQDYETAVEVKDGEDSMSIYFIKTDDDVVREMVLISESSVILMRGRMPVAALQKMAAGVSVQ